MRKLLKILRKTLVVLLIVLALFYVLLQTSWMQTFLTQKIASYLSKEIGAEITIERVDIDFFATLVLEELNVQDQSGDTLAYFSEIQAAGFDRDKENNTFGIRSIDLIEPDFRILKQEGDSILNLQFILDYLKRDTPKDSTKVPPQITIGHVGVKNGSFRVADFNKSPSKGTLNTNDIHARNLNIDLDNLVILGDSIQGDLVSMKAMDASGFELKALSGSLAMNSQVIVLENAHVEAQESMVDGRLAFKTEKFSDFNEFNNKVRMNHRLDSARIQLGNLSAFAPELQGLDRVVEISGKVKGRVKRLKGENLYVKFDENSWFKGNVDLDGLPKIESTFIILEIEELTSNKTELDRIPLPPFDQDRTINTPDNFALLGPMKFSGEFIGFTNDFTAFGDLSTKIGSIIPAITLHEGVEKYTYKGNLQTVKFDVGKFYGNKQLGKLTSDLEINGKGLRLAEMDSRIKGTIQSLAFNDYEYKGLKVDGSYRHQFFDGELKITDDNLFMDFAGKLDFRERKPVFSFEAEIQNINLVELNFVKEQQYSSLSTRIVAQGSGDNLADVEGTVTLSDFTYCQELEECSLDSIMATATWEGDQRKIDIESSVVSGQILGSYDIEHLDKSVIAILSSMIPSLDPPENVTKRPQAFELNLTVEDFGIIRRFFAEDLFISDGSRLDMDIDESVNKLKMTFSGDSLRFKNIVSEGITLDAQRQDSAVYFTCLTDHVFITDSLDFTDLAIDGRSENDTIYAALAWDNRKDLHHGDINGQFTVRGNENFDFLFHSAVMGLNGRDWVFDQNAFVQVDGRKIKISDFNLRHGSEFVKIYGQIADAVRPKLNVELNSFEFDNLNPFFAGSGLVMDGKITGQAAVQNLYAEPLFTTDLILEDLAINEYALGDICLESLWDHENSRLIVGGELQKGSHKSLDFGGFIFPKSERPLEIQVDLTDFDIAFLNAFMETGISDISGKLAGTIQVTGPLNAPEMNGRVLFTDMGVTVDYLNTRYELLDEALVYSDMIALNGVRVVDQEGNIASLVGTVLHDNFSEWNFDMMLDMTLSERFLCLNTNQDLNSLYYGKGYASGNVNVEGFANNLLFDINLKSQRGSTFSMPLGGSQEVSFEDFVVFVNDEDEKPVERLDLTGISLNFELDITQDVEFQLVFDEALGDVMKGSGTGHISMDIDPLGNFNMYGVVTVVEGNYLFTLKNLISKSFEVRPGGTISWYGDPLAADIALKTVYKLDASLHDLFGDDLTGQYSQRVPVELVMDLDGKLLNPGIHFDIDLPRSDEITKSRVKSVINTDQERNRQAFSLLVLRRFVSPPNIGNTGSGGIIAENSSEFISSQVSNWLSQISDDFDIGINYRPGDEITNEQLAIALSTQLFNERLSISGNFGVSHGTQANQNPSSLIGDIKVEYKITKDGKVRLVAYNETNDFDLITTDQATSRQGVGVLYQQEFDTLDEFYCELKKLFRREDDVEIQCP